MIKSRDEKAKEKIAEETEAAEKKKRQDQERRQQNIVNATRVEFRTELLEKTRQQHAEMRKQMEEEAKLQKERIDALAKETPYAEKLANLKVSGSTDGSLLVLIRLYSWIRKEREARPSHLLQTKTMRLQDFRCTNLVCFRHMATIATNCSRMRDSNLV